MACLGCGCAAVVLLAAVGVLVVRRPEFKTFVRTTGRAVEILQRMQRISEALQKYVHDKGDYPPTLEALTPTYLPESVLRPSPEANATPFEYRKPPAGSGSDFVIVSYEMPVPVAPGRGPSIRYYLTKSWVVGTERVEPSAPGTASSAGRGARGPGAK